MAPPDKTPASQRFVRPSSSATQHSVSARKPGPAFSQRVPPSSGHTSGRVVRFGTPAVQKDDISNSFEADNGTLSVRDRENSMKRGGNENKDKIEYSQEDEHGHDEYTPAPFRPSDVGRQGNGLETPMPKRRKRAHSQTPARNAIAVSSSPSAPSNPDSPGVLTDNEDVELPDTAITSTTTSRFRTPAPVVKSEDPRTKPIFRPPDSESAISAEMTTTLPEAFTPSRKKGKRDYVSGGLADTVRSWVLQAAAEETQRGTTEERSILVGDVVVDQSRRGISCMDNHDRQWLLVGIGPWDNSVPVSRIVEYLRDSGRVVVRGTATSWAVSSGAGEVADDLLVASHWDVEM